MMFAVRSVLAGVFLLALRLGGRAGASLGVAAVSRCAQLLNSPSRRRNISGQVPRSRLVVCSFTARGERKHGRSEHLTRPDQIKPPLGSVGQLLRPALLSPRRQGRDNKGRALGFG